MEDTSMIIRAICHNLYENLRKNTSIFSIIESGKYLNKLKKINNRTEYMYAEIMRDELGILYRNHILFCQKKEYEKNSKILKKIKKMYIEICYLIENNIINSEFKLKNSEYANLEKYIKELNLTYGSMTEKYIKRLMKKNIGNDIKKIYKDKAMITSEKKKSVINIMQEKKNEILVKNKNKKRIEIIYNYEDAKYKLIKINDNKEKYQKIYGFNTKFGDIEKLQKDALKSLKKMNFGVSIYEELEINEECMKYIDPFILKIFIEEDLLDYAKIYIRKINGETKETKSKLPFKIVYKINEDSKIGALTPVRNAIIAIIAERSSLSVAKIKKIKSEDSKKNN